MGYNEMYHRQREDHKVEHLTKSIIEWKEVGQEVIGKIMQVTRFQESEFDGDCNVYLIETDTGLVSVVLGETRDKLFEKYDLLGRGIYIRFNGSVRTKTGRTCNDLTVDLFHIK